MAIQLSRVSRAVVRSAVGFALAMVAAVGHGQAPLPADRSATGDSALYSGAAPPSGAVSVPARGPSPSLPSPQITDRQLAIWVGLVNRGEIAVSQIAQQRAQSALVREFAQQMVREHTVLQERLNQFADVPVGAGPEIPAVRSGASLPTMGGMTRVVRAARARLRTEFPAAAA